MAYTVAMLPVLAYAEAPDTSNTPLVIVLLGTAIIVVTTILIIIIIGLARSRRHSYGSIICSMALLWGLLASLSSGYACIRQLNWSKERMMRINTGYYDSHDNSDAPRLPWVTWAGLAASYAVLAIWAVSPTSSSRQNTDAVPARR